MAAAASSTPVWVTALKVLPSIAIQVVFLAPMEAMRTIQKNGTTGNLPLLPYASMTVNGILWTTYGALQGDPTICISNASAILFGSYYWRTFNKHKTPGFNMAPYVQVGAATTCCILGVAALCPPALAANILGLIGNACVIGMFAGPLTVMRTVIAEKSTAALPFGMTIATLINCSLWFSYAYFVIDDPYIWVCNLIGLSSSLVQLALFARFGFAPKALKL